MTILTIVLSAIGGALELAGLALVVREIAKDRQRARQLFPPASPQKLQKRRYPPRIPLPGRDPWAGMTVRPAGELEQQVGRALAMLGNGLVEMRKAVDAQLDTAIDELRLEAERRETEIRSHLGYVLAGSSRDRVLGAVFLAFGILFGVAANISSVLG